MNRASAVSTHVLDIARGLPAAGVTVRLELLAETGPVPVGQAVTDADGRAGDLGPSALPPGTYRLVFGTGAYFAARGIGAFFPEVTVTFLVSGDAPRQHVPLLLSPFAYSTYRGS